MRESYSQRFRSRLLPIPAPNNGASAFNTCTARGRLLLLDPARGEEKLGKNSGNTTAWWWSSWFSCRASPSSTEEEEMWERGGLRLGCGVAALPPPLYL